MDSQEQEWQQWDGEIRDVAIIQERGKDAWTGVEIVMVRKFKIFSVEMTGLRVLSEGVMRKWEVSRMTPKFLAETAEWVGVPLMKVGGQKEKQI